MRWFKHYSDTRHSDKISKIEAGLGFAGLGRYFRLLELLSEKFNSKDQEEFVFVTKKLRSELGASTDRQLGVTLQVYLNAAVIYSLDISTYTVIKTDIMVKLRDSQFGRACTKHVTTHPKSKSKSKSNSNSSNNNKKAYEEVNVSPAPKTTTATNKDFTTLVVKSFNKVFGTTLTSSNQKIISLLDLRISEGFTDPEVYEQVFTFTKETWSSKYQPSLLNPKTTLGDNFSGLAGQAAGYAGCDSTNSEKNYEEKMLAFLKEELGDEFEEYQKGWWKA